MKMITLNRITASAWDGADRVGYSYVDFPTDFPEHVVDVLTVELVRSLEREYPGWTVEIDHDEIAWSA